MRGTSAESLAQTGASRDGHLAPKKPFGGGQDAEKRCCLGGTGAIFEEGPCLRTFALVCTERQRACQGEIEGFQSRPLKVHHTPEYLIMMP